MNTEEHIKQVIRTMSEGDELVNKARLQNLEDEEDKEDEEMTTKSKQSEGFDPGKYNKSWVAALTAFATQWGVNFNESINQVVMNPPENMLQAMVFAGVAGGAVWYVRNREN